MYKQEPKQLIDVGEIGNASTGDILYDGGVKLNNNVNAIYNAFGDQRKMSNAEGQGATGQKIHATGYYQKPVSNAAEFGTSLPMGSQYDIDTAQDGTGVVVVLGAGVPGEGVNFINSNGSISVSRPLTIQVENGRFKGLPNNLVVTTPYSEIKCVCVDTVAGAAVWDYSIRSMFGQEQVPVDGTWAITTAAIDIPLFHKTEYNTAKLLFTCQSTDGKRAKTAEINILIDPVANQVVSTEYAVIRIGNTDEDDVIATISFSIDADVVKANVASSSGGLRVALKTIATQKIGVPQ